MQVPIQTREFRFGAFEVDLRSGELRKHGMKIKLQVQPFQILALLLKRPGEMVSREEMRQELWSPDTTVDFDMGLNSAIKRLRDALGDTAETPRFIETLPRRGYRFIAQVQLADSAVVRDDSPQPSEPERLPPQKPEVVALQRTGESLLPAQTRHSQEEAYPESDDASGKVEPVFERIEIGRLFFPAWRGQTALAVAQCWNRSRFGCFGRSLVVADSAEAWPLRDCRPAFSEPELRAGQ